MEVVNLDWKILGPALDSPYKMNGIFVWSGWALDDGHPVDVDCKVRVATHLEVECYDSGSPVWPHLPGGAKDDEVIMAVPRDAVNSRMGGAKICVDEGAVIYESLLEDKLYARRGDLENDEDYKQIIPYIVVRHGGMVLACRRTSGQSEERLHDKVSLGFGGHIDRCTFLPDGVDPIMASGARELYEELSFPHFAFFSEAVESGSLRYVGIINDNETEVGRVHAGCLFELDLPAFVDGSPVVGIKEQDKMVGSWEAVKSIGRHYDSMETWSKLAYDCLFPVHRRTTS